MGNKCFNMTIVYGIIAMLSVCFFSDIFCGRKNGNGVSWNFFPALLLSTAAISCRQ